MLPSMTSASSDRLDAEGDAPDTGVKSQGSGHEVVELAKTVIYALLIAFVLRVLLFQPFTIPSASMEPTLTEGDYIIVSKFAYGWSKDSLSIPFINPPGPHGRILQRGPDRGDIVVFKLPRDGKTDYIKRLVGLPGDRMQVKQGQLYINDQPVQRTALPAITEDSAFGMPRQIEAYRETLGGKTFTIHSFGADGPADNTGVYVVPKGCYFMMGDNRDNSLDSRFPPYNDPNSYQAKACPWNDGLDQYVGQPYVGPGFVPDNAGVGFVPAENLVGKADIILFSWKPGASLFKPWTWLTDARWGRFFNWLS
jgi:signal peptidase I